MGKATKTEIELINFKNIVGSYFTNRDAIRIAKAKRNQSWAEKPCKNYSGSTNCISAEKDLDNVPVEIASGGIQFCENCRQRKQLTKIIHEFANKNRGYCRTLRNMALKD